MPESIKVYIFTLDMAKEIYESAID